MIVIDSLCQGDVMIPEMDGIEFYRLIKEDIETSHIPFLMLTAKDALESRLEGVESGADFYFSQPSTRYQKLNEEQKGFQTCAAACCTSRIQ